MFTSLEEKRQLIEDLELLDHAVTKRLKVNPKIYNPKDPKLNHNILTTKRKISKSITITQKHEVKKLMEKYNKTNLKLLKLLNDEMIELNDKKILKRPEYEKGDFSYFFETCDGSINSTTAPSIERESLKDFEVYDIFSCNENYPEIKVKIDELEDPTNMISNLAMRIKEAKKSGYLEKHRVLSSYTTDIKLSKIFSTEEVFGTQLDLKRFYKLWLSLPRYTSLSQDNLPKYKFFFKNLITRDGIVKIDTIEYKDYLKSLIQYLTEYYEKVYPLDILKESEEKLEFKHDHLFCLTCNRQFSKDTVYNSHLSGKKHVKAEPRSEEVLSFESKIAYLINFVLKNQYNTTLQELERIDLLTVRELELEKRENKPKDSGEDLSLYQLFGTNFKLIKKIRQRNTFDSDDSEDELVDSEDSDGEDDEDEKLYNPLNLPIGVDGRPIPFWLFKLKGLRHEFKCEICDNASFQGRNTFNKHFKEATHINKLKEMGVTDNFIIFKDISTKKEVQKLLDTLQQKHREQLHFIDNTEEVEDDHGNAMNKKVYEQLAKQGLL